MKSGGASKFFAFVYYDQTGFSYYKLQYDGDVTYFKSGLYSGLETILLPDNKTIMLRRMSSYDGTRYSYTHYVLNKEDL